MSPQVCACFLKLFLTQEGVFDTCMDFSSGTCGCWSFKRGETGPWQIFPLNDFSSATAPPLQEPALVSSLSWTTPRSGDVSRHLAHLIDWKPAWYIEKTKTFKIKSQRFKCPEPRGVWPKAAIDKYLMNEILVLPRTTVWFCVSSRSLNFLTYKQGRLEGLKEIKHPWAH